MMSTLKPHLRASFVSLVMVFSGVCNGQQTAPIHSAIHRSDATGKQAHLRNHPQLPDLSQSLADYKPMDNLSEKFKIAVNDSFDRGTIVLCRRLRG